MVQRPQPSLKSLDNPQTYHLEHTSTHRLAVVLYRLAVGGFNMSSLAALKAYQTVSRKFPETQYNLENAQLVIQAYHTMHNYINKN